MLNIVNIYISKITVYFAAGDTLHVKNIEASTGYFS